MFKSLLIGAACCAFSLTALAQENLVGKWGGSWRSNIGGVDRQIGLELEITSVEGNIVRSTMNNMSNRGCNGVFPVVGKLNGNELGMIATEAGGAQRDCKPGFRATIDGTKMTGKYASQYDMTLNKK